MKIKEVIKRIFYYVSVPKCVYCKAKLDYEDRGLCKPCIGVYKSHMQRNCPHCAKMLSRCFCSYDKLQAHGVKNMVKLFRYSRTDESMPSNYLIYSLKQDNRADVLSFLTDELCDALRASIDFSGGEYVITNVPRRRKAIINYGYDHAKDLAVSVSKQLNIEYVEPLCSKAKKSQKSVYGHARVENAKFDYKCKKNFSLKGKKVILVDDIVTTGASMSNCATLLKGLGARVIIGACLGMAYKEAYIDFGHSAFK